MRHGALLLPFAVIAMLTASCGGLTPYATSVGALRPGDRMIVRIARGTVNAYAPAVGDPKNRFTVEAFAGPSQMPAAPQIKAITRGIEIDAPAVRSLLVRVPDNVDLTVYSAGGDVNVTDISGTAVATTAAGRIAFMLPAYGQARVLRNGSISAIIGAAAWPGTLAFSTPKGDVSISVNENDRFRVDLATDDGTIFTDFNLRGTAHGRAERIVGAVGGGSGDAVVVRTGKGAIRLLRLAPQY
jgi:hypothetical protein